MVWIFNNILSKIFRHKYILSALLLGLIILLAFNFQNIFTLNLKITELLSTETKLKNELMGIGKELEDLKNEDQVKINQDLRKEIVSIEKTYDQAVVVYEKLLDYSGDKNKKGDFEKDFAKSLKLLSDRNFEEAGKILSDVSSNIDQENQKAAVSFTIPENVTQSNTPPGSGYSRQRVSIDIGEYLVDVISADLNSTRVIVDTASDADCRDNCPTLPLATYISRSGAFAGVNGSYFCPAEYPSCAGKANAYDTLAMNKNKVYINSDNNVYSSVPAVIFSGSLARFVGQSLEWGRDTGVDAVLANHPLLVAGSNVVFGGNSDPKQGSRGSRSFVGNRDSTVFIGVVHNATVAEVARVLQAMGMHNALNLDSGGSTALWHGGYKVGPGRNIPNALLFIRK